MTDLLRAEGVSAFYGASQILFDIDLALRKNARWRCSGVTARARARP